MKERFLNKKLLKLCGNVLMAVSFVFIGKAMFTFDMDYSSILSWSSIVKISGLTLVYMFSVFINAFSWKQLLFFLSGKSSPYAELYRIYSKSNLGKYLPGNVMQFAGRNLYGLSLGLSQPQIAFSSVLEVLFLALSCFVLCLCLAGRTVMEFLAEYGARFAQGHQPLLLAGGILISILAGFVLAVCIRTGRLRQLKHLASKQFAFLSLKLFVLYCSTFLLSGFSLLFILSWTIEVDARQTMLIIAAYTVSWLIGFVIPGVPGGLGVRETILSVMLQGICGLDVILFAAVIQRIISVVGDILAYLISFTMTARTKEDAPVNALGQFKRIGLFASWLSKTSGGIENTCYNLFVRLQDLGHHVRAFSLDVDENEKYSENVFYAHTSKRTVPILSFFGQYRRWRRQEDFDINIAPHWGPGLVALGAKIFYRTPYIVYAHGKDIGYCKNFIHRTVVRVVLRNAKNVVANSNYTAHLCESYGLKETVVVIHPGMDDEIIEAAQNPPVELPDSPVKLFSITRLVKRKGIDTSIKAVRMLVDEGLHLHYNIAGSGEYQDELEALVRENELEDYVSFLGRVSVEEKIRQYEQCHLFLMPSYEIKEDGEIEGFGIVYTEANALGKFVVAGNSGGVPDAVRDGITGFLVDGENTVEVKKAVTDYLAMSPQEKLRLSSECREWARLQGWKDVVLKVDKLIREKQG